MTSPRPSVAVASLLLAAALPACGYSGTGLQPFQTWSAKDVAFASASPLVAIQTEDREIDVEDLTTKRVVSHFEFPSPVSGVQISAQGTYVVAGRSVFDRASRSLAFDGDRFRSLGEVVVAPDETWFAGVAQSNIHLYRLPEGTPFGDPIPFEGVSFHITNSSTHVMRLDVSYDGRFVRAGDTLIEMVGGVPTVRPLRALPESGFTRRGWVRGQPQWELVVKKTSAPEYYAAVVLNRLTEEEIVVPSTFKAAAALSDGYVANGRYLLLSVYWFQLVDLLEKRYVGQRNGGGVIYAGAASARGIYTCSFDGSLFRFEANGGEPSVVARWGELSRQVKAITLFADPHQPGSESEGRRVRFSPNGRYAAVQRDFGSSRFDAFQLE